jgi:hypothetical protein
VRQVNEKKRLASMQPWIAEGVLQHLARLEAAHAKHGGYKPKK